MRLFFSFFFFFHDPPTTEIYTLSLHDALPISSAFAPAVPRAFANESAFCLSSPKEIVSGRELDNFSIVISEDRKSTRLNSSHVEISYAVFCLKKKKKKKIIQIL